MGRAPCVRTARDARRNPGTGVDGSLAGRHAGVGAPAHCRLRVSATASSHRQHHPAERCLHPLRAGGLVRRARSRASGRVAVAGGARCLRPLRAEQGCLVDYRCRCRSGLCLRQSCSEIRVPGTDPASDAAARRIESGEHLGGFLHARGVVEQFEHGDVLAVWKIGDEFRQGIIERKLAGLN